MNDFIDTLLNIEVFAFIALLVWLYVKPSANDRIEGAGATVPTFEDPAADGR